MRLRHLFTRIINLMMVGICCFALMSITPMATDSELIEPQPPMCMEDDYNYIIPHKLCIAHGYSQAMYCYYRDIQCFCEKTMDFAEINDAEPPKGLCDEDMIRPNKPCILRGMDRCW